MNAMVDVKYYRRDTGQIIYTEERAAFVPDVGDEVCLPPDDDPSNYHEGGWHAFTVQDRRYFVRSEEVVCYIVD